VLCAALRSTLCGVTITKILLTFACLGASIGSAQSPNAKIVDVRAYAIAGPSIVAPNNGYAVVIPTSSDMFTVTVALDEMVYSVEVRQSRHAKPADFIVGDSVEAHLDRQKLIVITPSGKRIKEKIIRRERLPSAK
jgi:hypothetical protein